MREPAASVGRLLVPGALLAGVTGFVQAQMTRAQSRIRDKFVLNLGGFVVGTDVTAHRKGSSSTNPDIDFDPTFGDGRGTRSPRPSRPAKRSSTGTFAWATRACSCI